MIGFLSPRTSFVDVVMDDFNGQQIFRNNMIFQEKLLSHLLSNQKVNKLMSATLLKEYILHDSIMNKLRYSLKNSLI